MTRAAFGKTFLTASIIAIAISISHSALAETVVVKHRGAVDLKPFKCETIYQSSVVKRLCYDAKEGCVVVNLNGIHYHCCEI